jgi:hypothetical protein
MGLPLRDRAGAARRVSLLGLTLLAGVIVATSVAPVASADPPPNYQGGWVDTSVDHGPGTATIHAAYWYIDPTGAGACPATVTFLWDDAPVSGALKPPGNCATTPVTFSFIPPTRTTQAHAITACFYARGTCISFASETWDYTIDPVPSLALSPKMGLAASAFKATYSTGENPCGAWTEAQFSWDGKAMGRVKLDASCHAIMTFDPIPAPNKPGKHTVQAIACNTDGCRAFGKSATFTVNPNPTPTPSPTPKPTPKPTPTPSPTASPTATPTPSPSPSPTPTAEPTGTASPTASPAEAVLGATSPPRPTASPAAAAAAPTSSPGHESDYIPALVSSIEGPDPGGIDPAVVTTNLLLTLLILFLFGLTSEIFNSTMDSNRDTVHGWWQRLLRGPLALFAAMNLSGRSIGALSGRGRIWSVARVILVLSLIAIVYGFLSPDFGLNAQSAILILSLVIGCGFLTFFTEGSTTRLARRRYHATASVELYGTAILVAILAVIVSRLVDFLPGLVYGFIASAVIVAPAALAKRDDATLVLVPAFGVLIVSVLAFLLLGPVRAAAAGGEPLPALAESILAMIMVGGLEGLFITMIPLTFMDGAVVKDWNRIGWAITFGIVTFLWWQLLLNRTASYLNAFQQQNVQVVLFTLVVFMLTTGGLWSYFRFFHHSAELEPATETESEPEG